MYAGLEAFKGSAPEPSVAEQMAKNLSGAKAEHNPDARVGINAANLIRQNAEGGMAVQQGRTGRTGILF